MAFLRELYAQWRNKALPATKYNLAKTSNRINDELSKVDSKLDTLIESLSDIRRSLRVAEADRPVDELTKQPETAVLDFYVSDPPSYQTAFKLFEGEWSSDVPGYGGGHARAFDDHRVKWFAERCGGFQGKHVLELGPLEGAHTSMIAKAGAASVTAIESNSRAFLKCLIVQNALGFNATFMLGDFTKYLERCQSRFDIVIASGVLYHMSEPAMVLKNISNATDSIGLWTHYYDAEVINSREDLQRKFAPAPHTEQFGSREIHLYKQSYLEALQWKGFCGGSAATSYWFTRESLLGVLEELGFDVVIGDEAKNHPNGPAMTLFATRKPTLDTRLMWVDADSG